MLAGLFLPESSAALVEFARAHRMRCRRLVVDARVAAVTVAGQIRIERTRVRVVGLIVVPHGEASDLGWLPVSANMQVAFQPCVRAS